jgi:uncharacterized membrane protein
MTSPPTTYTNRYGRRQTRGVRPWLLLPKVIAVAVYLGGLASATVLWWVSDLGGAHMTQPQRLLVLGQVRALFTCLLVPALLTAIVLGIALLLQHPRVLLRQRWLIVKLIWLAVLVPAAHLYLSSRVTLLRRAITAGETPDPADIAQVQWGLALAFVGFVIVAALARLKPRLRQNWARGYPAKRSSSEL